jgi:hypothetical protein
MKIKTQFDKAIVDAAGIDTSFYSEAEITDYATKLVGHPEVQKRAQEILTRSVAAQAIAEILSNPATKPAKQASLHNMIVKECGAAPPVLK